MKKVDRITSHKRGNRKGDNGKLLIVGGSEDYVGCLALAGTAALRTGCDIVTIAAPSKAAWTVNCLSPDLITKKIRCKHFGKTNIKAVKELLKKYDAMLIGPGIGLKSKDFVKALVKIEIPKVIDADALKMIKLQEVKNSILTPHKKEFEILLKNSGLNQKNFQKQLKDNILLLKGKIDYIYTRDDTWKNTTGNKGMTKGGTGDVLAGIAAGFLAQKYSPVESAKNAAFINGKVGDMLKKKHGYAYIASEIAEDVKRLI